MSHKSMLAIALLLLLQIPLAFAAETFDTDHLKTLFNNYQRQQAYDYARQYLAQMEGDPYFDYMYGVSAIDAGHASQGVFALERVLLAYPDDHVARLELARGYFILEEYPRARQEFEKVLALNPPKAVQETTQNFLDQIRLKEARYRTTSSGYVALGYGSDTNVNSGVDQDKLTVITSLDANSLGQDDSFSNLSGAWQITVPFAPGWMFNTGINADIRKNSQLSQFDTLTGTLQLGVSRLFKDSQYKGTLLYQDFNLDGDKYRSLAGLNLDWIYAITQKSRLTTNLQYVLLDYPDQDSRNSSLASLSLSYSYSFSGSLSPYVFLSANIGQETPDDDSQGAKSNTDRSITGLRTGINLTFTPRLAFQTSVGLQKSEYGAEQTFPAFFGITRSDDFVTADMALLWLFSKDWRLDTRASYIKNDSNVELYNYDRTQVSLSVNYAF